MVSCSAPLVLLALALSVLSTPVPKPQNAVSVVEVPVLPTPGEPVATAAPSSPITFGSLTAPSQGKIFDDFQVLPPANQPKVAKSSGKGPGNSPPIPHGDVKPRFLPPGKFQRNSNVEAKSPTQEQTSPDA